MSYDPTADMKAGETIIVKETTVTLVEAVESHDDFVDKKLKKTLLAENRIHVLPQHAVAEIAKVVG